MYQALADPSRRRILRLLQEGPLPSGEIAGHFEMSWPSVSRHLSVLSNAGLIRARRNGQQLVYELTTSVLVDIVTELAQLSKLGERSSGRARAQPRIRKDITDATR